jgi:hypothetical protein
MERGRSDGGRGSDGGGGNGGAGRCSWVLGSRSWAVGLVHVRCTLVGGVHVRRWGAVVRGRVVRGCWGVVCGHGGAGSCVV